MGDLRAALQDALGPLYRVEREVRPAGRCRMFVASELPDGPGLLVKVLPGGLSLAVDAAVFERELILLADRLADPHLVAARGAGRAGACVFHTRPFIQGTTLRAWLARHGNLPLRMAVELLRDVLAGLAHAHRAGVVHGDLKPDNVLLAAGRALVVDAGVIGAVGRALPSDAAGAAPAALCTPAYLAPERRSGGGHTDPRDDMFAVGVLVYEVLTGKPPAAEAEPVDEVRALPQWLAELVDRCRTVEPAGRWADAGAALEAWPSITSS